MKNTTNTLPFQEFIDCIIESNQTISLGVDYTSFSNQNDLPSDDISQQLEIFWASNQDTSIEFLKFLAVELRKYRDNLLVYTYYKDKSCYEKAFIDYKELALDWLNKKRIELGDNSFDVISEDIHYRRGQIILLQSSKLLADFSIHLVEFKVYEYKKKIDANKEKLIKYFKEKTIAIDKEDDIKALDSLKIKLFEELRKEEFEYLRKHQSVKEKCEYYEEKIEEIEELLNHTVERARDKKDVTYFDLTEKILMMEYLKDCNLFSMKETDELYALYSSLFYSPIKDVRKAYKKALKIHNSNLIGKQFESRIANLQKIKAYFLGKIGNKYLIEAIEQNILKLESSLKK